jgi:dinuclear metal center YbgI/SA1388 family protein
MADLDSVVNYCDLLTNRTEFKDYPGAKNGLQISNSGAVYKIGASVDGGLESFQQAAAKGIDFLIVHHGIFWGPIAPIAGSTYSKLKLAFDSNIALYSSHLPLDAHPEFGNNILLAKQLELSPKGQFGAFEGKEIGWWADYHSDRASLSKKITNLFPSTVALEHGTDQPKRVGIMTGSGGDLLSQLANHEIDTLITGECSQHHFSMSQELGINLYLCGHYATEVFAVQRLAELVSEKFQLPWSFIDTGCPL